MSRKTKASKKKKKQQVPVRKIPNWVYPTVLIGLIVGCFLLRTLPGWNKVFVDDLVLFRGTDPWYHMRLVDNMMVNFPWPLEWDMVALFPEGMNVGYFPLLSWMIAIPGQIFNYEVVGALLPPILGALTLIPIYFICKILWKDWVGLVACTFAMILPTEFFHRSLVGFTDHHILEIFFMACTILFLILIQKDNRLRWKILGGVSLGLYLSSWIGGLLLVLPIWLWFFGTFLYKHRKHEEVRPFCMDLFIVLGLGFLIYLPNIFFIKGTPPFALATGIIAVSPIVLGRGELAKEGGESLVEDAISLHTGPVGERAGDPGLSGAGGPGDDAVIVVAYPVAACQGQHEALVQPARVAVVDVLDGGGLA